MLRAMLIDDRGFVQTGDEALVRDWQAHQDGFLWLDLHVPDNGPGGAQGDGEDTPWLQAFGVHPLAIQDVQRTRHPPKYEAFTDMLFILLRSVSADSESIDLRTVPIALFLGKNFLISRHSAETPSIDEYWMLCTQSPAAIPKDRSLIGLQIGVFTAGRYLELLNDFEPRLWTMEQKMFRRPRDTLLNDLVSNRTSLRYLTRIFNYHVRVFQGLRQYCDKEAPHSERSHLLNDLYEKYDRLYGLAHMFYDVTGDLIDGYLSTSSHRLNNTMRILTIITVLFVPLNFITGLYGMNFDYMPELHSRYGFYIMAGLMGCITLLLLGIFRYKRWL
jgi:magnesium transporter